MAIGEDVGGDRWCDKDCGVIVMEEDGVVKSGVIVVEDSSVVVWQRLWGYCGGER